MKRRGMEAVASKSTRRAPVFLRKKAAPSETEAASPPMMEEEDEDENESEDAPLTCPKCGAELADTEENRAYVKAREDEDEDED